MFVDNYCATLCMVTPLIGTLGCVPPLCMAREIIQLKTALNHKHYTNYSIRHTTPASKIALTGEAWSWDSGDISWACGLHTVRRYFARAFWNHTCKTRFESPVFCESCFKSFASGLWFIAKYAFIALSWWCLKDVRMRLGLVSPLWCPRWLSASVIVNPAIKWITHQQWS